MSAAFKIFIGYDSREKIAFHVLSHSIISNATIPVTITPINLNNLKRFYNRAKAKKHSTEFSISRFLTPYLSNYKGYSLYLDCDFIVLGNIAKLLKIISFLFRELFFNKILSSNSGLEKLFFNSLI